MRTLNPQSLERMKKVRLAYLLHGGVMGPTALANATKLQRDHITYLLKQYPEYWSKHPSGGYSLSGSGDMLLAAAMGDSIKVYTPDEIIETGRVMAEQSSVAAGVALNGGSEETLDDPIMERLDELKALIKGPQTWKDLLVFIADNVEALNESITIPAKLDQFATGNHKGNAVTGIKIAIQAIYEQKG